MNQTVQLAHLNEVQMKLTMDKWLLGQCSREDSVGKMARLWVSESADRKIVDHETWVSELGKASEWATAVLQAKNEYVLAADCLSREESAPTFPRMFADPDYDQKLEQWSEKHKAQPE